MISTTMEVVKAKRMVRAAMKETFGSDNPPGVFVRSDTNVEDLAGFTGAGLNLTLPNVVGFPLAGFQYHLLYLIAFPHKSEIFHPLFLTNGY